MNIIEHRFKSGIQQLRELLALPPTVSDQRVIEESEKFIQTLETNKSLNAEQRNKFLAAYKKTQQIIGQVQKTDIVENLNQQNWMRQEQNEKQQLLLAAFVLSLEKRADEEEEQEELARKFKPVKPEEVSRYKVVNPVVDTYSPVLAYQNNYVAEIIEDLKLQGIFDVEAQLVQVDGQKTIMLMGLNPENSEKVREIFKNHGYEIGNSPVFNPKPSSARGRRVEDEELPKFNPQPKVTK